MKYKKSLGQNFFNNPSLAKKIVDITISSKPKCIVEIGAGGGYFTDILYSYISNLIIFEKDEYFADILKKKYPKSVVINIDFLDVNLKDYVKEKNIIVFGSLPYNVSKPIIKKCLEEKLFTNLFFIIQKEVADKFVSPKSSVLSILTKLYADTEVLFDIHPGSFRPKPKVTSSFIHMKPNDNVSLVDVVMFERIVKNAFKSPRKTIKNNVKSLGINLKGYDNLRAEDMKFDDFVNLSK